MSAEKIDGKALANKLKESNTALATSLKEAGIEPKLAILSAEGDIAGNSYARSLKRAGKRIGLTVEPTGYPDAIAQDDFDRILKETSRGVHGVLVMRPLPEQLDPAMVDSLIDPLKDVDGVHPQNAGLLALGRPSFIPATARSILHLLKSTGVELKGKRAVIVGRSPTVGKPLLQLLLAEHLTVTVCHSRTADLPAVCREADVLAVAIGRARMVTPEFVKPGAIVLDAGFNWDDELGHELGDVDPAVAEVAGWLSPVPGGVGPVTTQLLLENALVAAQNSRP